MAAPAALPLPAPGRAFRFAVDRGGTFTDVYATYATAGGGTADLVVKLLSEDPANYPDAPREGIRRALERATGVPHTRGAPLDTARIAAIRMGTTVATNALLERTGERCALVTTRGFRDLLHIGTQARPAIFDLTAARPGVLHEAVVEVDELVTLPLGTQPGVRAGPHPDVDAAAWPPGGPLVTVATGETVCVRRAPDLAAVERDLAALLAAGVTSVAVVFKHAALFPDHEAAVGAVARRLGFRHVALSHECAAAVRMVPRGYTADADAYLTPAIARYLDTFRAGFDAGLGAVDVAFMQSDGGLARADRFSGYRAILSGPAGGYVGYARTTQWEASGEGGGGGKEAPAATGGGADAAARTGGGADAAARAGGGAGATAGPPTIVRPPQIIGFDMGGTSTDVSRYAGAYELVHEATTAGVTVAAPQLDINTVAAGGGSRLFFRHGMLAVGPESAGAHPGPLCYRKGGHAAVTDANVVLGRVQPAFFPAIFGPAEDQPLDAAASAAGLAALLAVVNAAAAADGRPPMDADGLALGFVDVANEAMCRPIRALTQAKGYDAADHALAVFGGAGAQHACAVAAALGMRTVFVHRHAGVLSAVGIALADVAVEAREPAAADAADAAALARLGDRLAGLAAGAAADLAGQGCAAGGVRVDAFLNVRYDGTDVPVMVAVALPPARGVPPPPPAAAAAPDAACPLTPADVAAAFEAAYRREFGFVLEARRLVVDDVRVRAVARGAPPPGGGGNGGEGGSRARGPPPPLPPPAAVVGAAFAVGGRQPTPVFRLDALTPGQAVRGPALVVAETCTVVVEPACTAHVTCGRSLRIDVGPPGDAPAAVAAAARVPATLADADPVRLALFSHRFMGIAEQMGRVLQRTAVSVNIKERLDFSCALFGPDGGLVANAPHLPVHLGAMSEAVRYQIKHWGPGGPGADDPLAPGDVVVSNHPQLAGGSHLPDITVITPVFHAASGRAPVFFVASRGHHADVGGATPGSMPPSSTTLADEGAAIVGAKLVRGGALQEAAVAALLAAPPPPAAGGPAPRGTRCLADNVSDLRAQAAANARGIALVGALIDEAGADVVLAYMVHIQANAEASVRTMLKKFAAARLADGAAASRPADGAAPAPDGAVPAPHGATAAPAPAPSPAPSSSVVVVHASDQMDDGTPIQLSVTVDAATGDAVFDFAGTGPQVIGNTNAPPAVTASAVVYALRCMVASDIPLNQGCLAPVTIALPRGCLLAPRADAAVVGGNVLTSQRVTDVVLKAFGAAAASQGCMNNFTFGDAASGYYETIAGGGGAGPGWHGAAGVHTHMTNTRITDPEVLERRYPVVLHSFSLRRGSGGAGAWRGGDGVVREVEFLRPMTACVLTERRATRPFGLAGGGPGAAGVNLLLRRGALDEPVSLGGKAVVDVVGGDRIRILTPGGGGYGAPGEGAAAGAGEVAAAGAGEGAAKGVAAAAPPRAVGSLAAYRAAQESA